MRKEVTIENQRIFLNFSIYLIDHEKPEIMKPKFLITFIIFTLLLGGCFVYSFYPLYTEKDLFPNSLLLGKWAGDDATLWNFEYISVSGDNNTRRTDSTGYYLTLKEKGKEPGNSSMEVRIVRLKGNYFLDFYINEIKKEDYPDFFDLHTMPVHTFARLTFLNDSVSFDWMNPNWVIKMTEDKKLKIKYLQNDKYVLLTAKTPDLQKFMIKYARLEEAYKEGMNFKLGRIKPE
jgi:hypothetical protein